MTGNKKGPVVTTERKIGKVTYIICSSSSDTASETLEKKIRDFIKRDVQKSVENSK